MANTTTNIEVWKQSIGQLGEAADALDQAHSTMKDIACDSVRGHTPGAPTIKSLVLAAVSLLGELKITWCDDCGHQIALHDDQYGCQHERGDRDGVAQGPCGCDWGQRPGGSGSASANTPR